MDDYLFVDHIKTEVCEFSTHLSNQKDSRPITLIGNQSLLISKRHVVAICDGFIRGTLSAQAVEYMANCIELSDNFEFEDEDASEAIFRLGSPEINDPITMDLVEEIKATMQA
ncbi:MAG: hypothetical protein ACK4P2_06465 [Hyphomonas sp.]